MQRAQALYFIDNSYLASFYCSEIRKKNKGIIIHIFRNFGEYCERVISQYSKEPFVQVNYYFYEAHELLDQLKKIATGRVINFVVSQGIDKVKIDLSPLADLRLMPGKHDNAPIIKHCLRGIDIKFNPRICEDLIERANKLHMLKNIYTKGYFNLDEFLERVSSNLINYLKADLGKIALWEKVNGSQLLYEKTFHKIPLVNYEFSRIAKPLLRIEVKKIDEIKDKRLKNELKGRAIKYHIKIPIQSQYASGYLDFFSKADKIGRAEHDLIKLTFEQIALIVDNTYFFQNMLKSCGTAISIFDNTEDAILVVDNNRLVVDINESCEKLTGWSKREAIGKPCKLLWHSHDFYGTPMCDTKNCPMLTPLLEKRSTTRETVYTRDKIGARKIVKSDYSLSKNVIGNIDYGVAVVRDLTKRIELEEKLQHFEQLAALGKFAAELAHEIRNPVTGISSNAQFLYEEANLDKKYREIAKEIFQGAGTIEATVKKFLNLGHPPEPHLSQININQLIKEILGILKKKMDRTRIRLASSLARKLPYTSLDYDLIQQVFINIIMNSIEAMENGGTLKVETRLTHKGKSPDQKKEKYIEVKISDTGYGIPAENLDKIFDPFFTTKPTGSGLGLYTAYRIIKNHDASIEVRSEDGEGTQTLINFKVN